MYHIKCNHCGKLVEVKSEYMIFCPACKHKMDNSYVAWKTSHPGKSYADYLSEMCVSDTALEGVKEQRRIGRLIGRGRAAKRAGIALGIAVVVTLLGIGGYWAWNRYNRSASITALLNKAWQISYYEDLGATLKFPFPLQNEAAFSADSLQSETDSITADTMQKQVILSAASRRWSEPGVLNVTASRIDYQADFGVDREIATRQILMNMLHENSLQGFEFFRNDYSIPNVDARSLSGSYLLGVEAFEFRALMAQYGHTVWYFMVAYPQSKPEGLLVAERFFNGILIDRQLQGTQSQQ